MTYVAIVDRPIDPAALVRRVGSEGDGAVVLFLGTVRSRNEGRTVTAIEYEAYRSMAERVLSEIALDACRSYIVSDVAIEHRVGRLVVGDVSVAIAVAAPHRDDAYRASRVVIDRLKREAPIWKKEEYAEGEAAWLSGVTPAAIGTSAGTSATTQGSE